jgi:hypothetical protein
MNRSLLISFSLFVTAVAHAQTFPGNADGVLLPSNAQLPKTFQQIQASTPATRTVQATSGTATSSTGTSAAGRQNTQTSDVFCDITKVGTTTFQFGGFTGKVNGNGDNTIGGMMIRGGFVMDPGFHLKTGHNLGWVQQYVETGGANTNTIDAPGPSPLYPVHPVPGITTPLVDIPFDTFAGNTITSINFESVLVCWDTASPKDLHGIGSFLWGYDYAANAITDSHAYLFTPPIQASFTTRFAAEFGAAGTKDTGWTLTPGCDDCFEAVPEPSSFAAIAVGLAVLLRRRRRA